MRSTDLSATLLDRIRLDTPAIAEAVRRSLWSQFPDLDALAGAHGASIDHIVRSLIDHLSAALDGRPMQTVPPLVAGCREQAAALGRAGRPQHLLIDAYDYGLSAVTAQMWRRGRPGDHGELVALTIRATSVLETVRHAIADAYWSQAKADRFGRVGRRAVAHALLTGRTPVDAGAGDRYRCAVLRRCDPPGTWEEAVSERLHDERVLHCVLPGEIVAFVPDTGQADVVRVGKRPGLGPVAIGVGPVVPVVDVPVAVAEARRVAGLALSIPLVGVVVSADQLPLECTLLQDEQLAATMRALAAPIALRPDLLNTIRALYQLDLNRTSTARRLGIARRTLSGRLTRIHELTGLDPTSTRGIQLLHTALTALAMRGAASAAEGA